MHFMYQGSAALLLKRLGSHCEPHSHNYRIQNDDGTSDTSTATVTLHITRDYKYVNVLLK
jgi:hypothetical protein